MTVLGGSSVLHHSFAFFEIILAQFVSVARTEHRRLEDYKETSSRGSGGRGVRVFWLHGPCDGF